jgi:hypothetical protein
MHPISAGTETQGIVCAEEMILVVPAKVEFYIRVLIPLKNKIL